MDGKIFFMLVAKDEESRYLQQFIEHHDFFDGYFLYDDRSEDNTATIAEEHGWNVVVRPEEDPSFMEHEGRFRHNSWKAFEETMQPSTRDWIVSIDSDEFLISNTQHNIREALEEAIYNAEAILQNLVVVYRREIWKMDETGCYLRMDGFWRNDRLFRIFKYQPYGEWSKKPMGCGSVPKYVGRNGFQTTELEVLHFGYTDPEDRNIRYKRYMSLPDHGHNDKHIKSIISTPQLKKYLGSLPEWVNKEIG